MKERLQKIISASGYASRRAGEELIKAGRVTVNGTVASLGDSADAECDEITVDGIRLSVAEKKTYIMLNKPRGYVTTMKDEQGRRCVAELIKDCGRRVYPVGRLDMYSEGLLIMTDDGDFANKLMHPSGLENKTYHACISGACTDCAIETMRSPMTIDGYRIKPAEVSVLDRNAEGAVLEITIHEGRNRQIRKMCELAGLKLTRLKRVSEASFLLGDLQPGKWRYITETELQEFFKTQAK
ncbi:MAG: pseudouridine synthase [Bacillota bacterium]|nr:pseudouridine synthase [Bacillota bacterium]